jgi:DNA-binding protein HU-beta
MHRQVEDVIEATFETIIACLANAGTAEFRNFGTIGVREFAPRTGRNPNKPEEAVPIPRRYAVRFKAGKRLKKLISAIKAPSRA